jgi:hypothetical protein
MAVLKYKDPVTGEWHSTAGGSTAGGVDVTAEVGQTIVVKEVDENGKPTKWKAVDYLEPLAGSTKDITPMQVYEAILEKRPVTIGYNDPTYGQIVVTSFTIFGNFGTIQASAIVYNKGVYNAAVLLGIIGDDSWQLLTSPLQPLTTT